MNRQVVLRLLDTYFRHKVLYLVPVVLLGAAGVWSASSAEDSYQSFGTMKVERATMVGELTGSQQDPDFGWSSPAAATADSINSLLRTQTFVDEVIAKAGLQDAVDRGLMPADDVRGSIAVWPDGARLVKFVGTNRYPDIAYRVAGATMETYIETVIENENSDSKVAIEFLEAKIPEYEAAAEEAEAELAAWSDENPVPEDDRQRPGDEQVQLDRLLAAVALQDQELAEVAQGIEQAELSSEQKEAEVRQRLEVIDPPQQPSAPEPKLRAAVMKVAMALLLGAIAGMIGVAIGTVLDRTVRYPADVKTRMGARVLAVVPHARLTSAMRAHLQAGTGTEDTTVADGESHDGSEASPVVAFPGPAGDVVALDGRSTVNASDEPTPGVRSVDERWAEPPRTSRVGGERR